MACRRCHETWIGDRTIDRQTLVDARADRSLVCGAFALASFGGPDRCFNHHWPALDVGKRRRQPETMGQPVSEFIQIAGHVRNDGYAVDRIAAEQHVNMVGRGPEVSVGDPNQLVHRRAEVAQRRRKGCPPRTCGQLDSAWGRYREVPHRRVVHHAKAGVVDLEGSDHAGRPVSQYAAPEAGTTPTRIPDDGQGQRRFG